MNDNPAQVSDVRYVLESLRAEIRREVRSIIGTVLIKHLMHAEVLVARGFTGRHGGLQLTEEWNPATVIAVCHTPENGIEIACMYPDGSVTQRTIEKGIRIIRMPGLEKELK